MSLQPIRTDRSNTFAHGSMSQRLPGIIREVQQAHDYPQSIMRSLDDLHDAMVNDDALPDVVLPAPDADIWRPALQAHQQETWLHTEWFFAETYFFRQIVDRVRYWQTGVDPFGPIKARELIGDRLRIVLEAAHAADGTGTVEERVGYWLERALWGNRMDLSHPQALAAGANIADDDLIIDERAQAVTQILSGQGVIHIIADNVGGELASDLMLIDGLLSLKIAVVVHLKMHPTYVSDATVADVHLMLGHLPYHDLQNRLLDALASGQLRLAPDFFWNSPYFIAAIPPRIRDAFATARLVIFKGDANYRRVVNDTIYPVATPLANVTDVPAPILLLRTLKSDPVLGLSQKIADHLDRIDAEWRVNGKRGVIQYVQ